MHVCGKEAIFPARAAPQGSPAHAGSGETCWWSDIDVDICRWVSRAADLSIALSASAAGSDAQQT